MTHHFLPPGLFSVGTYRSLPVYGLDHGPGSRMVGRHLGYLTPGALVLRLDAMLESYYETILTSQFGVCAVHSGSVLTQCRRVEL